MDLTDIAVELDREGIGAAAETLFGWGRSTHSEALVVRPTWREAGLRIVDVVVRDKWMRARP